MSRRIHSDDKISLQDEILSECTWSETYSTVKHILRRTANQLPLLISFLNTNPDEETSNDNYRSIYFFYRTISNKLLLAPLRQNDEQPDQFNVYPKYCTFLVTDFFKGNSK